MKFRSQQKKKKGRRNYEAYLIIGGKGQGKSTFLRDQVDVYLDKFGKVYEDCEVDPRVFIHDMSGSRAFSDIMTMEEAVRQLKVKVEHPLDLLKLKDKKGKPVWKSGALRYVRRRNKDIEQMYNAIADHFRNGLLILDEWTTYVKYNPPEWQVDIINNHRNYGLEVFFVVHQMLRVPSFFSRGDMLSKIILFDTGEANITYNQILKKYSCADALWEAWQRVQEAKETDRLVQYHELIIV